MSNTSLGLAEKGSHRWMQEVIDDSKYRQELEDSLKLGKIDWISPIKNEDFKEYTLNSKSLPLKILKLNNFDKCIFDYWPTRQSQWDAIGIKDNTLILVEAKAHTSEIKSNKDTDEENMTNAQKNNLNKIEESIAKVMGSYGLFSVPLENWLKVNYQIANRLVFLNYLRNAGVKVKLVFLNFINDYTNIEEPRKKFEEHYDEIIGNMFGTCLLNDPDVIFTYYDVTDKQFKL